MTNSPEDNNIDAKLDHLFLTLDQADFDLYAFMDLCIKEISTLTRATGVVVEIAEGDEMVYRAATGTMEASLGMRLPRKGSITGLCVEKCEVLICKDTETDPRVNLEACRKVGARSLVVAPLFRIKRPVGVLKIISDKPDAFSEKDVETLQKVANILGPILADQLYQDFKKFF
ncbi:MAG TPA: GAF domain-containing protein [Gammaproteobacteria bacterium]|jgi:putative methionine-R-sulfoxide reductase with GAF domain|nr:GAF domain-containing protein [Gammaproteobacteria bacterium]